MIIEKCLFHLPFPAYGLRHGILFAYIDSAFFVKVSFLPSQAVGFFLSHPLGAPFRLISSLSYVVEASFCNIPIFVLNSNTVAHFFLGVDLPP